MGIRHNTARGEMTRSMFPFDDFYRETFNGSFLPSQNAVGAITPPTVPDPRYKAFPLDEAPRIPLWRAKKTAGSTSTTLTSSPENSPNVPEIGDKSLVDSVTAQLKATCIDGNTTSTATHTNPQRTTAENGKK